MWARTAGEIGRIIRAARRQRKLSQAGLARLLGTTQAWVSEIEKGKETAQIGLVLRALTHLDVRLRTDTTSANMSESDKPADQRIDLSSILARLSDPGRTSRKKK